MTSGLLRTVGVPLVVLGCGLGARGQNETGHVLHLDEEAEYFRTIHCVKGNLPEQLVFWPPVDPGKLATRLAIEDVDSFIETLDSRIATLLAASGKSVAEDMAPHSAREWNSSKVDATSRQVVSRTIELAADVLSIEYCGEASAIGVAVVDSISRYIAHATREESWEPPEWARVLEEPVWDQSIVWLVSALRLAESDHVHGVLGFVSMQSADTKASLD